MIEHTKKQKRHVFEGSFPSPKIQQPKSSSSRMYALSPRCPFFSFHSPCYKVETYFFHFCHDTFASVIVTYHTVCVLQDNNLHFLVQIK